MSPIYTALSGLQAQGKRLEVSASNVANAQSLGFRRDAAGNGNGGFQPMRVEQTSRAQGGVSARAVPVSPASVLVYQPSDPNADAKGLVPRANVDLSQEFVSQILAQRAYEASARLIQQEDKRQEILLNLLS